MKALAKLRHQATLNSRYRRVYATIYATNQLTQATARKKPFSDYYFHFDEM